MASCVCAAAAAAAMAAAPNFTRLAIASLLVEAASIVHHLILPFASQLAPSRERGKILGVVLSGDSSTRNFTFSCRDCSRPT